MTFNIVCNEQWVKPPERVGNLSTSWQVVMRTRCGMPQDIGSSALGSCHYVGTLSSPATFVRWRIDFNELLKIRVFRLRCFIYRNVLIKYLSHALEEISLFDKSFDCFCKNGLTNENGSKQSSFHLICSQNTQLICIPEVLNPCAQQTRVS